jgi:hypothetical protein
MVMKKQGKSFSNGNGPGCGASVGNGLHASPATVTITGVHLGAGDDHWAKMA